MEALKAEIERKKKAVAKTGLIDDGKKYFKRGDLAKKQAEDYFAKLKEKRKAKGEDVDLTPGKKLRAPSSSLLDEVMSEDMGKQMPSRAEVIRRLRERNEPIRLFGESDVESFQRLRKLEILAPEINKGMRNDFKAAMDAVDQAFLNEIQKTVEDAGGGSTDSGDEGGSKKDKPLVKSIELDLTFDEIKMESQRLMDPNISVSNACDAMLHCFQYIFTLWAEDLNSKDEKERRTMKAKLETATYNQTITYMKPLFRKLKKRSIPDDIFDELKTIAMNLMRGEYVRANDAYYMIAIGNAAWPIGVTMVGIHARTGREKIFSQHVAHVLNDEQQRKYIQGLKRLMTKLQTYRPTDPSKSVEFGAIKPLYGVS